MEITLRTIAEKPKYCIGKLYIDGSYFCDTIEDTVRNLSKEVKVPGKTAIPAGRYRITLKVVSPRFGSSPFFKQYANGGRLPRLINVPFFDGVLIHTGNTEESSAGCVIIGRNTEVGKVTQSKETFKSFYKKLKEADERGEDIYITIKRLSY